MSGTTYTLTGPNAGSDGVATSNYTVTPDGTITGTITPQVYPAGSGTFSPASLSFSASAAAQTFTFTPNTVGNLQISAVNNDSLINAAPVPLYVNVPISVITNAGAASIATAGSSGPLIAISAFEVGSDLLINDSISTLQGLTSVRSGGTNSSVYIYVGSTELQYEVLSPNEVMFLITLDETIGNFTIGNLGLYNTDGTLFCLVALDATTSKVATSGSTLGNRRVYECLVSFNNAATLMNLTTLTEYAYNLATVATELLLPSPVTPTYNVYLVQKHTILGIAVLALNYNSLWYYIPTQLGEAQVGGVVSIPPGMLATGVNPGDAVYYNPATNKFTFSDPNVSNYLAYPQGIVGEGNFIFFNNTVYTATGNPFVAGQQYFVKNGGATGNVATVANGGNAACPVGYALTTNILLLSPNIVNEMVYGSFTVNNSTGTVLSITNGSNTVDVSNLAADGNISAQGKFLAAEGSGTGGGYTFTGDTTSGLLSSGVGTVKLYAGGIAGLTATSTVVTINLPSVFSSAATFNSTLITDAGITVNDGVTFGSIIATSPTDLSKHINLYGGNFGLNVTSNYLNYSVPTSGAHAFYITGVLILTVNANGISTNGTITATNTITGSDIIATSDRRLKTNVENISNALATVRKLRGVKFNRKGSDRRHLGFIAQETKEHVPEVVFGDNDEILGISYGNMVALLVEAVKELAIENEELRAKL